MTEKIFLLNCTDCSAPSSPSRAIKTDDYLYIRNFFPERWPAGDPVFDSDLAPFGDCDNSPSKKYLINHSDKYLTLFRLAFAKRPYEELYDLRKDPQQFVNVADKEEYRQIKEKLSGRLDEWMKKTRDPRSESPRTMAFDKY